VGHIEGPGYSIAEHGSALRRTGLVEWRGARDPNPSPSTKSMKSATREH
jgi:hypothetical protein